MNALTIRDLAVFCAHELQKGHADYTVFVTDDEEANGYHALFYSGCAAAEMDPEDRKYMEEYNHDISMLENTDKAVYIG